MKIWVYLENHGGEITDISLQCLEKGRQLALSIGGTLEGVALGSDLERVCQRAGQGGASVIYRIESKSLLPFTSLPYLEALRRIMGEHQPRMLLLPASTQGNDIAPALAGAMRCGSIMDCVEISFTNNALICQRLEYDRKVLSNYVPVGNGPAIVTLVDGVCEVPDPGSHGEVRVIDVMPADVEEATLVQVIKDEIAPRTVNLRQARIIVGGGAGAGNREGFKLVEELAGALGAEVGATRASVDAGWVGHDRQIGQTGAAVRPDLYIACGISGAVQHRVGILGDGKVVAINTDPGAPIFRMAHYAIVGDLRVVIPKMIQALGKKG
ncbi:MAG: electron transfer flavoprotein subunit alpha/FixB family protein [Deltaproteobacteria bacterium]|nr:electron transfer flavoprotein subunit alpha/FixB family protein [Deltaproteobacteria bacterium]MBW2307208.1 electron transfer flavoprotein subunit alpha/FixB family protein [Deltaproteobacteria bacterium]